MSDEIKALDGNEEEYNPDILTLSDDDGKEYTFEVLDTLDCDLGLFYALLPVHDDPKEFLDSTGELVIVKVEEENGEEFFSEIEDDDVYETVADAFTDRLSDAFEIDNK